MKQLVLVITILIPLFFISDSVYSQDDSCIEIIETAVQSVNEQCSILGNNQACYGHILVRANPQSSASNFSFADPGDLADLVELQTLRVSALDTETGYWGIALMQLLAQVPESDPEEVSLLVFGSVEIENNVSSSITVPVEVIGDIGVNVRESPFLSSQSITQLNPSQTVTANGRLADNSWIRVQLPETDRFGWIFTDFITSEDDLAELPVLEAQAPHFGPLQAFQLGTGLESSSDCDNAPPDGLLVQTPEGVAEVTFLINEVNIQLRATAFVQAQAGHEMIVAVLDGQADVQVEGLGNPVSVPAGMMTRIALDENLAPTAPPTQPEPYRSVILGVKQLVQLLARGSSNRGDTATLQELLESAPPVLPSGQTTTSNPTIDTPSEPTPVPANPNQNTQNNGTSGGGGSSDSGGGGAPPGGGGGPPGGGGGPPG